MPETHNTKRTSDLIHIDTLGDYSPTDTAKILGVTNFTSFPGCRVPSPAALT